MLCVYDMDQLLSFYVQLYFIICKNVIIFLTKGTAADQFYNIAGVLYKRNKMINRNPSIYLFCKIREFLRNYVNKSHFSPFLTKEQKY